MTSPTNPERAVEVVQVDEANLRNAIESADYGLCQIIEAIMQPSAFSPGYALSRAEQIKSELVAALAHRTASEARVQEGEAIENIASLISDRIEEVFPVSVSAAWATGLACAVHELAALPATAPSDEMVEQIAKIAFEVVGYRPPNGEPWTWEHVVAENWSVVGSLRERARAAIAAIVPEGGEG
jgi:hypothetical protein